MAGNESPSIKNQGSAQRTLSCNKAGQILVGMQSRKEEEDKEEAWKNFQRNWWNMKLLE